MVKIKGWEKQKENKIYKEFHQSFWKNKNNQSYILVFKDITKLISDNPTSWIYEQGFMKPHFSGNDKKTLFEREEIYTYPTKEEAITEAIKYMRTHP